MIKSVNPSLRKGFALLNGYQKMVVRAMRGACTVSEAVAVERLMREAQGTLDGLTMPAFSAIARKTFKMFKADQGRIDLDKEPWSKMTRKEQVLHYIKLQKDRPVTVKEIEQILRMDGMSAGKCVIQDLYRGLGKLDRIAKVGPKGGAGFIIRSNPMAEILKEIEKEGPISIPLAGVKDDAVKNAADDFRKLLKKA